MEDSMNDSLSNFVSKHEKIVKDNIAKVNKHSKIIECARSPEFSRFNKDNVEDLKLAIDYSLNKTYMSMSEIQDLFSIKEVSIDLVKTLVLEMISEGWLSKDGRGPGTVYMVASKVVKIAA
jgi:hypothetical protein